MERLQLHFSRLCYTIYGYANRTGWQRPCYDIDSQQVASHPYQLVLEGAVNISSPSPSPSSNAQYYLPFPTSSDQDASTYSHMEQHHALPFASIYSVDIELVPYETNNDNRIVTVNTTCIVTVTHHHCSPYTPLPSAYHEVEWNDYLIKRFGPDNIRVYH